MTVLLFPKDSLTGDEGWNLKICASFSKAKPAVLILAFSANLFPAFAADLPSFKTSLPQLATTIPGAAFISAAMSADLRRESLDSDGQ